MAEKLMKNQSP